MDALNVLFQGANNITNNTARVTVSTPPLPHTHTVSVLNVNS